MDVAMHELINNRYDVYVRLHQEYYKSEPLKFDVYCEAIALLREYDGFAPPGEREELRVRYRDEWCRLEQLEKEIARLQVEWAVENTSTITKTKEPNK